MRVYLCSPIDGLSLGEAKKWRAYTTKQLTKKGIETYDPTQSINKKFLKSDKPLCDFDLTEVETLTAKQIVQRDLKEMLSCDMILVYAVLQEKLVNRRVPLGTFFEMGAAFLHTPHIPIIGVTNCLKGRVFWDGSCDKIYDNLDEAIDCIVESVEGFQRTHTDEWPL